MRKRLIAFTALLATVASGAVWGGVRSFRHAEASPTAAISQDERAQGAVEYKSRLLELLLSAEGGQAVSVASNSRKEEEIRLIPGGTVFGARISYDRVRVKSTERESPIREGDEIVAINGEEVFSIEDIKSATEKCKTDSATVTVIRGGTELKLTVGLKDGRLGLELSEGTAGIGTLTYIDPTDGSFGGLGHGICDTHSGEVLPIKSGEITGVILGGVQKGECGKPGELCGILTDRPFGSVYRNTGCGLFGKMSSRSSYRDSAEKAIPIMKKEELKSGEATVISTVKNSMTREYSIEITSINTEENGSKCFKFKVTDPTLIALTGGVVRGMSGSPIIQDGKLVGAVTHVMVADPTEGYGIFIENMLNAAQNQVQPKAA